MKVSKKREIIEFISGLLIITFILLCAFLLLFLFTWIEVNIIKWIW